MTKCAIYNLYNKQYRSIEFSYRRLQTDLIITPAISYSILWLKVAKYSIVYCDLYLFRALYLVLSQTTNHYKE